MRFLMLFLRLVLCAVCLFALCPSVPQADGSDTPDSLPLLAQALSPLYHTPVRRA